MRSVRLRIANALPALAIPFPNQFRIARECLRRRKLCRIKIPPVTVLAAKRRDAALSRNTRAGQNKKTHNARSKRNSGSQIITSQSSSRTHLVSAPCSFFSDSLRCSSETDETRRAYKKDGLGVRAALSIAHYETKICPFARP